MNATGFSVYDLLHRAATMFGARTAVRHVGGSATYAELLARTDSLAAGLAGSGIQHGMRICVLAQNNLEYFELYLAAAKVGAVVYPINWRLTAEEVGHVVTRAQPEAFVYDASCAEVTAQVRANHGDVPQWIAIGGAADAVDFATLYSEGSVEQGRSAPDDLFVAISTAAVDVIPRGAALSHANVISASAQTVSVMGLDETDAHLLCLPLFHITALGFAVAVLHAGGCNIILTKFDAEELVKSSDEHGGSVLGSFPPMLATLLDTAASNGSSLKNLRHVAGLEMPGTIDRLHSETSATFYSGFGQSETSGFVTVQKYSDRPGASGRIGMMADVAIFDEDDVPVASGEVGEIVVRGPMVMREYYDQPDVTAHTFRSGWHHTGDLGKLDDDGYLYYAGRKPEKELIKPGGENVYPAEVEAVIDELDTVNGVCVFGVPDEKWGEAVKAVVEADASVVSAQAIIDHVGSRIGRFKRPQVMEFTDALPRKEDGGVDREKVKADWGA
jgi:acyl-CoA synthetase (AMP-forming)/AMP-acid ligase II